MPASVTLFTDRSSFESAWRPVLEGLGAAVGTARPEQLPERVERDLAIVVDAGAGMYDEDELLAHLGLARALGAMPAVMMPPNDTLTAVDDLVEDLCIGLVARSHEDISRISTVLARRAGARSSRRFEYITVSPRGGELLAILADGSAVLMPRPVHSGDDTSAIASIVLGDDALRATIALSSGSSFELRADEITLQSRPRTSSSTGSSTAASNGHNGTGIELASSAAALDEIDGQRLGARVRELRLQAGLTQAELARRTGIHRPNIARVEAGRHTPSLETLARLAAAIGVPTTRVLTED